MKPLLVLLGAFGLALLATRLLGGHPDYRLAGNAAMVVFALAVILVYLLLAAQYESLRLPLAVILVVPMCLLCSVLGVSLAQLDVNIFVQIGLVVLVGLASKNAILIVEFANRRYEEGHPLLESTIEAAKLRFRPIIMTSMAFVLGVTPLAIASGAGSGSQNALGIGVIGGMLTATFLATFLIPLFYVLIAGRSKPPAPHSEKNVATEEPAAATQ